MSEATLTGDTSLWGLAPHVVPKPKWAVRSDGACVEEGSQVVEALNLSGI